MSILTNHMLMAAAGAQGGALDVADVFSTDLYTGNGSTQTITNGIDLAGEGGLVWIKNRTTGLNHNLYNTESGPLKRLVSNTTAAEDVYPTNTLTSYNSNGFTLSDNVQVNGDTDGFAAWTYRKSTRFFDVVTYTGDGTTGRTINHNLGIEPGMVIVKRRDFSTAWAISHRSIPVGQQFFFDTNPKTSGSGIVGSTNSTFTVDAATTYGSSVNASGGAYVAYVFAHDPDPDGIIQCGSFSTDGSGVATIDLGWEPQWVLIKRVDGVGSWMLFDQARGWASGTDYQLNAESSASEVGGYDRGGEPTNTGFQITSGFGNSTGPYIYMAIRAEGV